MGAGAAGGSVSVAAGFFGFLHLSCSGGLAGQGRSLLALNTPLCILSITHCPVLPPAVIFRFTAKSDPGADCSVSFLFYILGKAQLSL